MTKFFILALIISVLTIKSNAFIFSNTFYRSYADALLPPQEFYKKAVLITGNDEFESLLSETDFKIKYMV